MKPSRFITLDIGEVSLRLSAFAQNSSGGLELLGTGAVDYACDAPAEMAREARVAAALKQLLAKTGFSAKTAVMTVEGPSVFSRLIKLPPVSADRLQQTIRHEAVQNIPFPLDEVVWDSHVLDPSSDEPEVLLVAVKSDLVGGLVSAVTANGITVEAVDVAPAALANAVRLNYSDAEHSLLLVEIGPLSTHLIFIDGHRIFFRSLPVAGKALPKLLQEITRSISFYGSQQSGRPPKRVLLAGELKGLENPQTVLSDHLGVPVELFDPLLQLKSQVSLADGELQQLGVSVGLAVHKIDPAAMRMNLLPDAVVRERSFQRRQPVIVACVAVAVLIMLVWAVGLMRMAGEAAEACAAVSTQVAALEKIEAQMVPMERRIAELDQNSAVYRGLLQERVFWINALNELRAELPEGMFLLSSESLQDNGLVVGMRIGVVSYLDREPEGEDVVILLRDGLRDNEFFSRKTLVKKRPAKSLFARQFILDVFFEEPMPR